MFHEALNAPWLLILLYLLPLGALWCYVASRYSRSRTMMGVLSIAELLRLAVALLLLGAGLALLGAAYLHDVWYC